MVEQLGLATMPLCSSSASGLTSATTSGTVSSIRQRDELSTTTAPAAAKRGAHSPLVGPPAEKSAMSKPWMVSSLSAVQARSLSPQSISRPTERSDANATTSPAGKPRSRITPSMVEPTAPVAPTTATRTSGHHRPICYPRVLGTHAVLSEPERRVQLAHRGGHVILADHARDL